MWVKKSCELLRTLLLSWLDLLSNTFISPFPGPMSNVYHSLHLSKAGSNLLLGFPQSFTCIPQAVYMLQLLWDADHSSSCRSLPLPRKSLLTTTAPFRNTSAQDKAIAMSQNLPFLRGPALCWVLSSSKEKALSPALCHTLKQETGPQWSPVCA